MTLSLVGCWLALEVGLRIVGVQPLAGQPPEPVWKVGRESDLHPDAQLAAAQRKGWIPWPETTERIDPFPEHPQGYLEYHRNNAGFRDDDPVELVKPPHEQRVVILGDSHAEGIVPQHESFAALLEDELEQKPLTNLKDESALPAPSQSQATPQNFRVLNGAFRRSSPYQQWWAYHSGFARFSPDLVVLAYYAGNDLTDLLRGSDRVHLTRAGDSWQHTEPAPATNQTADQPGRLEFIKKPLRSYSSVYAALTRIPGLQQHVLQATADPYRLRLETAANAYPGWIWQGGNQVYYFHHHPDELESAYSQMQFVLQTFSAECRADGVRFLLVVIPQSLQVTPDSEPTIQDELAEMLEVPIEAWTSLDTQTDQIVSVAESLKIETIDLREPMREYMRLHPDDPLYYRLDQHLNPAGNRLVAEAIYEHLSRKNTVAR